MLTEQQGRCPTFLGTNECQPLDARYVVGGRLYCPACNTAMVRTIARSVQAERAAA